jgi:hypothetical protein
MPTNPQGNRSSDSESRVRRQGSAEFPMHPILDDTPQGNAGDDECEDCGSPDPHNRLAVDNVTICLGRFHDSAFPSAHELRRELDGEVKR